MTRPERSDEDQRSFVKKLVQRCPEPGVVHERIHYATGLIDDLDAVHAGIVQPYNSGVAEAGSQTSR